VPAPDATWQLLVGDESALPAILERSAHALPAEVFLEVPADGDIRREVTASARIHWLPRDVPKSGIAFLGYWKYGRASLG
jgi:NADPH-dependent ferric siderophore reductase